MRWVSYLCGIQLAVRDEAHTTDAYESKQKWHTVHDKVKKQEGLPAVSWRASKQLRGVSATERVREVIDIAYARYHKQHAEKGDDTLRQCPWLLDVTQCISRKCHCTHFRAMCSGSTYYSYSLDRMITPVEHLLVLGWPQQSALDRLGKLSLNPGQVRDLAGESMSPPCIGAVMTALALTLDIWE
eukprot:6492685-Amphidinium_carterae.8